MSDEIDPSDKQITRFSIDSSSNTESINGFDTSPQNLEYEFSCEIGVDTEQTVVCNHCNSVSPVPDSRFLEVLQTDAHCTTCGMPLGMRLSD